MSQSVLFICTGNYYRSRFAEYWFNHLAPRSAPGWAAISAGFRPDYQEKYNIGPLSPDARAALATRSVVLPDPLPMPRLLTADQLASSARVVALDEPEHRSMMLVAFPDWADRITYWNVRDVPPGPVFDPMAAIDTLVRDLLDELNHVPAPAWQRQGKPSRGS